MTAAETRRERRPKQGEWSSNQPISPLREIFGGWFFNQTKNSPAFKLVCYGSTAVGVGTPIAGVMVVTSRVIY